MGYFVPDEQLGAITELFLAAWVNGYREIGFLVEVPITLHDRVSLSWPSPACSVLPSTIQFDLLVFPWREFFLEPLRFFHPRAIPRTQRSTSHSTLRFVALTQRP